MVTRWSGRSFGGWSWGEGVGRGRASGAAGAAAEAGASGTTKARGDAAETRALAWLQARGLVLEERNYRLALGPAARGGEIDLVMRDTDGTLVFVEVRQRAGRGHGGAAASVTAVKQQRLVRAARHYLLRYDSLPPCRFDVVALDGEHIEWLRAAFDGA